MCTTSRDAAHSPIIPNLLLLPSASDGCVGVETLALQIALPPARKHKPPVDNKKDSLWTVPGVEEGVQSLVKVIEVTKDEQRMLGHVVMSHFRRDNPLLASRWGRPTLCERGRAKPLGLCRNSIHIILAQNSSNYKIGFFDIYLGHKIHPSGPRDDDPSTIQIGTGAHPNTVVSKRRHSTFSIYITHSHRYGRYCINRRPDPGTEHRQHLSRASHDTSHPRETEGYCPRKVRLQAPEQVRIAAMRQSTRGDCAAVPS
jgi:hypothetical protein